MEVRTRGGTRGGTIWREVRMEGREDVERKGGDRTV